MSYLVIPYCQHLGFEESNDLPWTIYSRSDSLEWACIRLRLPECLNKASEHYAALMNNPDM